MIKKFLIGSARLLSVAVALEVAVNAVAAQTAMVTPQATLVSVPKVRLPKNKKFVYFGTDFSVWLSVNETGAVTAVNSVNGPGWMCDAAPGVAEMRDLAREAAMKAKFKPAFSDGHPIPADMRITLELDLPKVKGTHPGVEMSMRIDTEPKVRGGSVKTIQGDAAGTQTPGAEVMIMNPNVKPTATGDVPTTPIADSSKTISGGVLNGTAMTLTKPPYPRAARAVRATGTVPVQVLISEEGIILSAEAISGHPLLKPAARTAACSSKFTPTTLEGIPVKVSGIIVYNFVP